MSDHQHVWAKTGCYCGAQCCESYGYSDGTTLATASGLLPTGGRWYSCDQPAVNGTHCQFHIIAERYLHNRGCVSIALVQLELEQETA